MIVCIQSLVLNLARFCRCRSAERVSSRTNSLLAIQITDEPSLLSLLSLPNDQRKCAAVPHTAQSLRLSPRLTIPAARLSLKSP